MINVGLKDSGTGITARTLHDGLGPGLLAYTSSAHSYRSTVKPFINADFGTALNQDASLGGTPINIHNGGDNAYYTGSDIAGTADFANTTRPQNGTQSILWNSPGVGTISQFAGGSIDGSSYVATSFGINVDRRWSAGDVVELYAWDTSGGVQVGTSVSIGDYFPFDQWDTWHQVSIPFSALGVTTSSFDAFRIEFTAAQASTPDFYIDDWVVDETGNPLEFAINIPKDENFLADQFLIVASNNVAEAISPATLFGETFSSGITYLRKQDGSTAFSSNFVDMVDLLQNGFVPETVLSDGSNTVWQMRVRFGHPLDFNPKTDFASLTISEDFSTLTSLRAVLIGRKEPLEDLTVELDH